MSEVVDIVRREAPARTGARRRTATVQQGEMTPPAVGSASVMVLSPTRILGGLEIERGYLDAPTVWVRGILRDAASGLGAEDEEDLPRRFRRIVDPTPAMVQTLIACARDVTQSSSARRAAIIGIGALRRGHPRNADGALKALLADRDVGISEAALRAIDWGGIEGFGAELMMLASDTSRPSWLREYAADLAG
ncbi:MAG: hypothetical protein ABMB14_11050 [Myxococcota bacterium]